MRLQWDQQEYLDEGVLWNAVDFTSNEAVLRLLEGRLGILSLLNEECQLNRQATATRASGLADKLHAHLGHPGRRTKSLVPSCPSPLGPR